MRAILMLVILLLPNARTISAAGFIGPGSHETVRSASDVLRATDDSPCVLEGRIIAKIRTRKHRYLFEDDSGQVVVEIKRKAFGNQTVTPENIVRLEGEVDVDRRYPNEMDVDTLTVLK